MASAVLAAMRQHEFDPAGSFRHISQAAPSYSLRNRTEFGSWRKFDTFGNMPLQGDMSREIGTVMSSAPKYSMAPRSVSPLPANSPPGPGTYGIPVTIADSHPAVPTGPQWNFGVTERERAAGRVLEYMPQTPSPQEYHVNRKDAIGRVNQTSTPAWTMEPRRVDRSDAEFKQTVSPRPGYEYDVTHEHVDLTRNAAPKFTMRPRNSTPMKESSPAPGVYDLPTTVGSKSHAVGSAGPQWHFGGTERDRASGRVLEFMPQTPSPQEYRVTRDGAIGKANQDAAPAWTMEPRRVDRNDAEFKQTVSPRPGYEYDVTHEHVDLVKTAAPSFSMRPRNSTPMKESSPAPGVYDLPTTVGSKSHAVGSAGPQWHFGGTERDRASGRVLEFMPQTPSPQEYRVTRDGAIGKANQDAAPAWTMEPRRVDRSDAEFKQTVSPRPGYEYDVTHEHVDLTKSTAPKFSMRSKSQPRLRSTSPAPGTYDNPSTVGKFHPQLENRPQWHFGKTHRDNVAGRIASLIPETPSPQEYSLSRDGIGNATQEDAPAYSIGVPRTNQEDPEYRQSRSPRPSAHEYSVTHDHVNLTKVSAPKFSMRPRTPVGETRDTLPGPGSYDVSSSLSRSYSPMPRTGKACGFGSSKRFKDLKPDERIYAY